MFELRKWYLDCVDEAGNAAIAYWAKLRWRYIKLYYRTLSINGAERHCTERSWRRSVSMEASAPPIRRRLFESADGVVDWWCEMPRAKARIGDVCGDGYAEVLRMTVPPWKLPIDELRWGRFIGDSTWSVWIEWRGADPRTWMFVDGAPASSPAGAAASRRRDGGGPAGETPALRFEDERVLTDRRIGDALPLVQWLFPRRIRNARERKWCSRATLGEDRGWAIHEIVSFV